MRLLSLAFFGFLITVTSSNAQKQFGFDNRKGTGQPYLKPEETVAKMKVADGFEVKLFASEPEIVNPIAMTVDEKGRVWIVECFEYPKRTAKGKMPRDRIKILEDTDGDGVCDKVTTFIEGKDFPVPFDMASGIEVGNGGVYVGAPPYLFFIENKNDKPGKIDILLKGFGSEDTHETLNTFQWGPDGWLYGLHGIFTQSYVKDPNAKEPEASERGVAINGGIWRYHPKTKKFEVFGEGTSNPWGMDWRNTDGQLILCCCVIPHLFHITEGGIYKRQAGASYNPAAYQLLPEICDHTFHQESGWAHAGLISLDTPLMPEKYRDSVIFGSIHGSSLKRNVLKPKGSTFTASKAEDFLVSGDKNFRPINLRWGPNGEIYCIDWHDQNPCHQTAPDDWDYERGRVYRIQPKGLKTKKAEDLGAKTIPELLEILKTHDNPYVWKTALRVLQEKAQSSKQTDLGSGVLSGFGDADLRKDIKLRLLHAYAALEPTKRVVPMMANIYSESPSEIKSWMIRHAPRVGTFPIPSFEKMIKRAETETDPAARLQLAIAVRQTEPNILTDQLLGKLLETAGEVRDPVIDQALWLSVERRLSESPKYLDNLKKLAPTVAVVRELLLPNAIRRVASNGDTLSASAALVALNLSSASKDRKTALESFLTGLPGRAKEMPKEWPAVRDVLLNDPDPQVVALTKRLAGQLADASMVGETLNEILNAKTPLPKRIEAIRAVGAMQEAGLVMVKLALEEGPPELRAEAILALASHDGFTPSVAFLKNWTKRTPAEKSGLMNLFTSRKEGAKLLLTAVGEKTLDRSELTDNLILKLQAFKDKELETLIEKHWGRSRATPAELQATIDKMRIELGKEPASFVKGKLVFENQCSKCHVFEGKGHQVGPMIEGAGRDIEYLLVNVLDPNRVIGAPYFLRTVNLMNGKVESGVLESEDDKKIVLKQENALLKTILKADIEEMKTQEKSLMPEGLGYNMTTQDFRDLVRYVMKDPFVTNVEIAWDPAGGTKSSTKAEAPVTGRIPLPVSASRGAVVLKATVESKEAFKSALLAGAAGELGVKWNGQSFKLKGDDKTAAPDSLRQEVDVKKGVNTLEISIRHDGKDAGVFVRLLDPNRKLIWK